MSDEKTFWLVLEVLEPSSCIIGSVLNGWDGLTEGNEQKAAYHQF